MTTESTHLELMRTLGVLTGQAKRQLEGVWGTVKQVKSHLAVSLLSRDDIRQIVAEQMSNVNAEEQDRALQEHDRRLKAMSEALMALQEKITQLQASGHLNARTMSQAVSSIENDDHFSADERNILATILKQNIVLQKPELAKKGKA
ncbi:MAG: hypothetical protein WCO69_06695 [Candidatus Omnitrophota bacterium]